MLSLCLVLFGLTLLLFGVAWYLERRRYDQLWDDYRKLLNAYSVKTGGKPLYREPARQTAGTITPAQENLPRIVTPDMAETEAITEWERAQDSSTLTPEDMKHLGLTF